MLTWLGYLPQYKIRSRWRAALRSVLSLTTARRTPAVCPSCSLGTGTILSSLNQNLVLCHPVLCLGNVRAFDLLIVAEKCPLASPLPFQLRKESNAQVCFVVISGFCAVSGTHHCIDFFLSTPVS